jgi:hypothetical protein
MYLSAETLVLPCFSVLVFNIFCFVLAAVPPCCSEGACFRGGEVGHEVRPSWTDHVNQFFLKDSSLANMLYATLNL